MKARRGTWRQELTEQPWHGGVLLTGLLLIACSARFAIEPRTSNPGVAAPTMGWTLPHKSLRKCPACLAAAGSWRHILNWICLVLWKMWFIKVCRQNPQGSLSFSCWLVHLSPYLIIQISPPASRMSSLHVTACILPLAWLPVVSLWEKCEIALHSHVKLSSHYKTDVNKLGALGIRQW